MKKLLHFRLVLVAALALAAVPAQAQTTVAGHILDELGAPVSFANVQLRIETDSSVAGATISDTRGHFAIERATAGAYRIHISRIGYRSTASDVITLSDSGTVRVAPLVLQPEIIALDGVSVETRRILYRQQPDRLVINVGSSATHSGASALQVLERSPGVVVDRVSNSVSLIGKDGVRVLINGRPSYVPADGLVQFLSGINADNLERIELITAPPAEMDAEGSGGYINLVMRRGKDDGLDGSLAASGGYGGGELGNASASLNYRRGRASLFGAYSFLWNGQGQYISGNRNAATAEGHVEMPSASWRDPVQRNHDLRIGVDYRATHRTSLGALVAGYDNRWSMHALSRLTIANDSAPLAQLESDNHEVNHWRHAMANLNLRHQLAGGGSFQADLDYLRFDNDNPTVYLNTSTDPVSGETVTERIESGKTTPLRILVGRADFNNTAGQWRFGAGVKGAFSRFTNETRLDSPVEREWVPEAGFGSTSRLRENVLALYGSAEFTPRASTAVRTGLRYEHTESVLRSDEARHLVDRRFGSLFPSIAVSHERSEGQRIDASYTRRVTRPSFRDMAPFLYFFDPHTFYSGNAALQPAISNALKLDGTYGSIFASLQYAWEGNTIAQFQSRFLPEHRVHVMFPTNYRGMKTATALVAAPLRVVEWWNTQNSVMLLWQEVDGERDGLPLNVAATSYRFNTAHNFTLPRGYTLEATGFYQSASLLGTIDFGAMWQVNLGLQRTIRNGATVTLALNDVFDSYAWRWTTGGTGDPLHIEQLLDSSHPSLTLSYSVRLGGGTGKPMSPRSTASEEENARVQQ
jgi:hypothetical protein